MSTTKPFARSACAVANSPDVVGDKWSLLVVRDLLYGKSTSGELANSPEHIATNILQERPVRYADTLTPKGKALGDVLLAFVRWGKQHIPGTVVMEPGKSRGKTAASTTTPRRTRAKQAKPDSRP